MDTTEALRNEDISKTDFFDFVDVNQYNNKRTVYLDTDDTENIETNNNLLNNQPGLPTTTTDTIPATGYDPTFWNCDKETVRLETAILEDLHKYCWNQDADLGGNINVSGVNKLVNNNTDGHIYTLTVLNGVEQPTWYKLPSIVKEEDGSMSTPSPMDTMQQSSLDIDSILNIIPNQVNGYVSYENTMSPHDGLTTDGLIKTESYTYDDSGYADTKDEITNSLIIDTPLLEAHDSFNNNNNDWKIDNNNSSNNTADSLLRSALQGKAFVRYNGQKNLKPESNTELKRCLSAPPSKSEVQPEPNTNVIQMNPPLSNEVVLFEDYGERFTQDSDNPSSTHSMEDMLLCQFESVAYNEDYEKLKRIADEVAESVQQYCQLDSNIYTVSTEVNNGIVQPIMNPPTVTSTKPTPKKYKRSNSGPSKPNTNNNTSIQTATSTSNGIRKERSLHYCSICSKGFKDKYSVNVHIRTHTGEKPFACSLCGKSFRQKAHLAKHYQTHMAQKNAAAAGLAVPGKKATTVVSTSVVPASSPVTVSVAR